MYKEICPLLYARYQINYCFFMSCIEQGFFCGGTEKTIEFNGLYLLYNWEVLDIFNIRRRKNNKKMNNFTIKMLTW